MDDRLASLAIGLFASGTVMAFAPAAQSNRRTPVAHREARHRRVAYGGMNAQEDQQMPQLKSHTRPVIAWRMLDPTERTERIWVIIHHMYDEMQDDMRGRAPWLVAPSVNDSVEIDVQTVMNAWNETYEQAAQAANDAHNLNAEDLTRLVRRNVLRAWVCEVLDGHPNPDIDATLDAAVNAADPEDAEDAAVEVQEWGFRFTYLAFKAMLHVVELSPDESEPEKVDAYRLLRFLPCELIVKACVRVNNFGLNPFSCLQFDGILIEYTGELARRGLSSGKYGIEGLLFQNMELEFDHVTSGHADRFEFDSNALQDVEPESMINQLCLFVMSRPLSEAARALTVLRFTDTQLHEIPKGVIGDACLLFLRNGVKRLHIEILNRCQIVRVERNAWPKSSFLDLEWLQNINNDQVEVIMTYRASCIDDDIWTYYDNNENAGDGDAGDGDAGGDDAGGDDAGNALVPSDSDDEVEIGNAGNPLVPSDSDDEVEIGNVPNEQGVDEHMEGTDSSEGTEASSPPASDQEHHLSRPWTLTWKPNLEPTRDDIGTFTAINENVSALNPRYKFVTVMGCRQLDDGFVGLPVLPVESVPSETASPIYTHLIRGMKLMYTMFTAARKRRLERLRQAQLPPRRRHST